MTSKQLRIAARIDAAMQPLIRDNKDDVAILTGMSDHMADFKTLVDTAKPGVMDELCRRHPGFYRYAKVLETIAGAIQSGAPSRCPGDCDDRSVWVCCNVSSATAS